LNIEHAGGIMAVKKSLPIKRNARQKKLLNNVGVQRHEENHEIESSIELKEDAIKRQFKLIQKDYVKLMTNVTKGYGLIKGWIGSQAEKRSNLIKSRLIKI
jgi:hypothetical protein